MAELFIKDNLHESDNLWRLACWLQKRVEVLELKVQRLERIDGGLATLRTSEPE